MGYEEFFGVRLLWQNYANILQRVYAQIGKDAGWSEESSKLHGQAKANKSLRDIQEPVKLTSKELPLPKLAAIPCS